MIRTVTLAQQVLFQLTTNLAIASRSRQQRTRNNNSTFSGGGGNVGLCDTGVVAAAASMNFTGGIVFHGEETFETPLVAAADLTENHEIHIPHVPPVFHQT